MRTFIRTISATITLIKTTFWPFASVAILCSLFLIHTLLSRTLHRGTPEDTSYSTPDVYTDSKDISDSDHFEMEDFYCEICEHKNTGVGHTDVDDIHGPCYPVLDACGKGYDIEAQHAHEMEYLYAQYPHLDRRNREKLVFDTFKGIMWGVGVCKCVWILREELRLFAVSVSLWVVKGVGITGCVAEVVE